MVEQSFPNLLAVVKYLQEQGYKVSKSTAYKHQQQGKIRAEADGSFSLESVQEYARRWLKPADGSDKVWDESGRLQRDKLRAETKKIQAQARLAELKSQVMADSYMPRTQYEMDLAARAQLFKSDLTTFARGRAGDIIEVAGGDPGRAPELISWLLAEFEEFLGRYARESEFVAGEVL